MSWRLVQQNNTDDVMEEPEETIREEETIDEGPDMISALIPDIIHFMKHIPGPQ